MAEKEILTQPIIYVDDFLSGGKVAVEDYKKILDENLITLKNKDGHNMISFIFSMTLLAGIIICFICDIAISGGLTWSLISNSSIVFVWIVSFPCIILQKNRIAGSLISLSIFIIPYLYLLSCLIKIKEVFSIGAVMSVISIVFLWIIFAIFKCIGKKRASIAVGISFLLCIPFVFVVNVMLSKMISEPICDIWDALSVLILLVSAFISFTFGHTKQKNK